MEQIASLNETIHEIPANTTVAQPIFTTYDNPNKINNKIIIGENSKVHIIEIYTGKQDTAQTKIIIKQNATVQYTILQHPNQEDDFQGIFFIEQQQNSNFIAQIFSYGGKKNLINFQVNLLGKNTNCEIYGLEYPKHQEQHQLNLEVQHNHPYSDSKVIIKSILGDKAYCKVIGKILIAKNSYKSSANLQHHTILLSENAKIDSKPELEIYNDDVSCSHGSNIGQLDLNALLYMYSRGIPYTIAQQLLLTGFMSPIITAIPDPKMQQQITNLFCPETNTG